MTTTRGSRPVSPGCSARSSPTSATRRTVRAISPASSAVWSPPRSPCSGRTGRPSNAAGSCTKPASTHAGSVHPELVAAATSVVAATGGADDFDRLFDAYKNASTPQDQLRHLYALAEFDDEALVLRTCELCFGDDVKTQNAPFVLRGCIANRRHGAAAWTYVRQRWDDANGQVPGQLDRPHGRHGQAAHRARRSWPMSRDSSPNIRSRRRPRRSTRSSSASGSTPPPGHANSDRLAAAL